jgi:hypothetical protein
VRKSSPVVGSFPPVRPFLPAPSEFAISHGFQSLATSGFHGAD